jgi:hypothetical protein
MTFLPKLIFWEVSVLLAGFLGIVLWKILTSKIDLEGLLSGDDASGNTSFSPGRAQLLILTMLVALQYVMQVIHNPAAFPQIPGSWVAALGGSQVVYLGGKAQSLLFGGIKDRSKTGG